MKTSLSVAIACALGLLAPITGSFAADSAEEAANKQLVLDYYKEIDATVAAGKMGELGKVDAKYRDPGYVQHSVNGPGGSGMPGMSGGGMPPGGMPSGGMPQGGMPQGVPQGGMPGGMPSGGMPQGGMPGMPSGGMPKMEPAKLISIMAEGDKVIQVTSRSQPDASGKPRDSIIFNMFRVKNGKLIEHWDAFGTPAQSAAAAPAAPGAK